MKLMSGGEPPIRAHPDAEGRPGAGAEVMGRAEEEGGGARAAAAEPLPTAAYSGRSAP